MIDTFFSANLLLAFTIYFVGVASPGPSNLAIMGTAMNTGRMPALTLALGIICGSLFWGLLAALGLSAVLATYSNVLIIMKIIGGMYLLWLGYKSGRSALSKNTAGVSMSSRPQTSYSKIFLSGAALHITNPKAIFVWLSIVTFAMPEGAGITDALIIVLGCQVIGIVVFCGYALLFSMPVARRLYQSSRRWFEGTLALVFGYAGFRMLTSNL